MFQEKTLGRWFKKLLHTMLSRNFRCYCRYFKADAFNNPPKKRERTIMTTTTHNHSQQRQLPRSRYFVKKKWPFYYKPVEKNLIDSEMRGESAVFSSLWLNDSFRYCYFHDLFGWGDPNNYTSKCNNNNHITLLATNDFLTAAVKAVVCSLSDIIPVYWTLPFGLYMASTVNLPP